MQNPQWLNQNSYAIVATRCCIILKGWCRPLPFILRNRRTFRVLQYSWFFLWHKIIIILWNKTINEERRESTSFPGKTQDLDMEGLFWLYSQVRDTPRTCFLICKMEMISCVPWGLLVWCEDLLTYWYEKNLYSWFATAPSITNNYGFIYDIFCILTAFYDIFSTT